MYDLDERIKYLQKQLNDNMRSWDEAINTYEREAEILTAQFDELQDELEELVAIRDEED